MKTTLGGLLALAASIIASPALAQEWRTDVKDDLFSGKKTAYMLGGMRKQLAVYASCDTDRKIGFSVIIKEDPENFEKLSGNVILKVGDGEVHRFAVSGYPHNDEYGGFKAETGSPAVIAALRDMGRATGKIMVGLEITNTNVKATETYSSSGSTEAINRLLGACEIP